jgi:ABC-type sugar transport system ATPase subunit
MPSDVPPVLEARDLAKRYGAIAAVHSIGFSIRAGEILGVLGQNGAGIGAGGA